MNNAADYAQQYRALGASVLIDHQFYVPDFSNTKLASYPTNQFRDSISGLNQVNPQQLAGLRKRLIRFIRRSPLTALSHPRLYTKREGRTSLISTQGCSRPPRQWATRGDFQRMRRSCWGGSATSSDSTLAGILGSATALDAAGWYFSYEFSPGRLPSVMMKCIAAAAQH